MNRKKLGSILSMGLLLALVVGLSPIPAIAGDPDQRSGTAAVPNAGLLAANGTGVVGAPASELDAGWWSQVQEDIRQSEYHVTWQDQTYLDDVPAAYQAPNRSQNLRAYFVPVGLIVIPRTWAEETDVPPWRWELQLASLGAAPSPALLAVENQISYVYGRGEPAVGDGPALVESYRNEEEGLVQSFVVPAPPPPASPPADGAGPASPPFGGGLRGGEGLQLELTIGGDLVPQSVRAGTELAFRTPDGRDALRYGSLRAIDARGASLVVSLVLEGSALTIQIEDADAAYPIRVEAIITGLPAEDDWALTFGEAGAEFGTSVASAGDVDGDGYSDVIIGAPIYDGGLAEQGGVFVYHGSRDGLYPAPDWHKLGGQGGAHFGRSAATAGDVNGDGYADVIVGAPAYSNGEAGEGGIWVWHGSADGLEESASKLAEGNRVGAAFGLSVATAGDVNGDGYSDIIVGAPLYENGQAEEGTAWVWHGSADGLQSWNWRAEANQADASLGQSVASAGDINADGYADVIVGATRYTAGEDMEGAAFVWLGSRDGLNGGVNGNPINAHRHLQIDQAAARYGWSVSTAGDVNGDGYADVIVGAPYYTNGQGGEGGAWLYLGGSGGLSATSANQDEGNQDGAHLGWSVGTAGDVNGDGRADVIVGAPDYRVTLDQQGRTWVWYGQSTSQGISTTNDWRAAGEEAEAFFGTSVATAGDVDGDGYSDVIVGAPGHASGAGRCTVYHGGPDPLAENAGWTKASNQANALFGSSVGTAGDVNGDGYADVIVGAPRWDGGQDMEGAAWVYLGQATGVASAPHWYRRSNHQGAEFGTAVGTAGDVNGDGYDDVIVGAPSWHNPQIDEGAAFVYPGSSTGLDESAAPLWSKASDQTNARFGAAVGTAGDVNGDGYADIIVGAPFWQSGGDERGGAWLYYGSAGGTHSAPDWYKAGDQADAQYGYAVGTAGDVNGDGYSDVIIGSPYWEDEAPNVNEGRAWVYLGSANGLRHDLHWHAEANNFIARLGHAVGTAGDVNGDGYSDVIVGAPGYGDDGLSEEGKAWVFRGSHGGLEGASSWSREGGQNGAHYGWSVGTAGDVNGDGYADVIIGVELWSEGESYEGAASVYHGSAGGLGSSRAWHGQGDQASAHYGSAVGTAGDVNGDGYADVIVGAPNYNVAHPDEGQVFLYYGNGQAGLNLNPRQVRAGSTNTPIARLGWSDWTDAFCIRLSTQRPFGLGRARMEIEVKPLGVPFDATGTVLETSWWAEPIGAVRLLCAIDLETGTRYHWRARWRYRPTTSPLLPASRWVTMPWNGWSEQDLRTAGFQSLLPLLLRQAD